MVAVTALLAGLNRPVQADERPVDRLRAEVNRDGRYEVFAVNSVGMLFHRWQESARHRWAPWAGNLLGAISDVDTAVDSAGRVHAFVIDGGRLAVRAQQTPNGGWAARTLRMGRELRRITATTNQDGRLEVFAIGGDRQLYSFAQNTTTSGLVETGWTTRLLEGHDFREVAATRDGSGRLVVFTLGSDGRAYARAQEQPNGRFGPWFGLEGRDLVRISAARQAAGSVTLFALGQDGALYSRTQSAAGQPWRDWTKAFDGPVKDWSATDGDSGLLEVAAVTLNDVQLRTQADGGGYFPTIVRLQVPQTEPRPVTGGNVLDPFIEKDIPIRSVSLRRGQGGELRLFVINEGGAVFTVERPVDPRSSGTWAGHPWVWLGSPPINPTPPDLVAQMETCIERLVDPARAAQIAAMLSDELPQLIARGGAGTPFEALARYVSVATTCRENGPGNWRQTIGVWLGRQPTPESLGAMPVVTPPHTFAFRISASALNRLIDKVWAAQPKTLTVEGRTIRLESKTFQLIDQAAPAHDQIQLTVNGSVTELGQRIGLRATATAAFFVGDVWPDTSIDTPRPTCRLDVALEGRGLAGDIAEIVLDVVGDLIGFKLADARSRVVRVAQPLCEIRQAILSSMLLPRAQPGAPLETLGIQYDAITVDGNGLTAYAGVPPLPRPREPRVDWRVIDGSVTATAASWGQVIRFGVEPVTQEMTGLSSVRWTYDYPLGDASKPIVAQVTDQAGNNLPGPSFGESRLYFTFSVPNGAVWGRQELGTLTLAVTDADGQTAQASRAIR